MSKEELLALSFLNDRFMRIEESFDEMKEILNTHLDRYVGLEECFQRGQMEIENILEEISEKLRSLETEDEGDILTND